MAKKPPISELGDHLGYWLRFVSNHVSHAFALKVEDRGVTVAEWVVMRELFDHQELAPSELAEQAGMTRGAISKLVKRLCEKKLAKRTYSQRDRRYQSIGLTPAGRRLVPALANLADQNDIEFFGHLGQTERNHLLEVLREIVARQGWKDSPVD